MAVVVSSPEAASGSAWMIWGPTSPFPPQENHRSWDAPGAMVPDSRCPRHRSVSFVVLLGGWDEKFSAPRRAIGSGRRWARRCGRSRGRSGRRRRTLSAVTIVVSSPEGSTGWAWMSWGPTSPVPPHENHQS